MSNHHSSLAPSSWPGLDACPCYRPDKTDTKWSKKGTSLHDILESLLLGKPVDWTDVKLEDKEGLEWAQGYIRAHSHGEINTETRGELTDFDGNKITYGRIDAWAWQPVNELSAVDLFDYKSGQERNYEPQQICYAAILMEAVGAKRCRVHCLYGRRKKVHYVEKTLAEAWEWIGEFLSRVRNPKRQPVPCLYCAFCADRLTCPVQTVRAQAVADARKDWGLQNFDASKIDDPEELGKAVDLAKILEPWCKAVLFHAIERGANGWRVKTSPGNRSVTDISAAYSKVGIPNDIFLKCCDVRLGDLEEAYARHNKLSLAAAKKELNARLQGVVSRGDDKKQLVKIK